MGTLLMSYVRTSDAGSRAPVLLALALALSLLTEHQVISYAYSFYAFQVRERQRRPKRMVEILR
jgi:hypothetical protein